MLITFSKGLGFRAQISGSMVYGLAIRVWGVSGVEVPCCWVGGLRSYGFRVYAFGIGVMAEGRGLGVAKSTFCQLSGAYELRLCRPRTSLGPGVPRGGRPRRLPVGFGVYGLWFMLYDLWFIVYG